MKSSSYYYLLKLAALTTLFPEIASAVTVRSQSIQRHGVLHPHFVVGDAAKRTSEQNGTTNAWASGKRPHLAQSPLPPAWEQDKFSLCPMKLHEKSQRFLKFRAATLKRVEMARTSCGTDVVLKEETASGVTETCCPKGSLICAGCAKLSEDKKSCAKCTGGYSYIQNQCLACVDHPGWLDGSGNTCVKATCSPTPFKGFSSNQACCKCGGGDVTGTPFRYTTEALVLGQKEVTAHPVPRTAAYYSVDSSCELATYGLTIDSLTGDLKLAEGCSTVGCDRVQDTFSVSCTVTAHQTTTITSTAVLTVTGNWLSFGSPFLIATSAKKKFSMVSGGLLPARKFELACLPSEAQEWLKIDGEKGDLTVGTPKTASGLTGYEDFSQTAAGVCSVRAIVNEMERAISIAVVAPNEWASMAYETSKVFASVGEFSATYPLTHVDNSAGSSTPPTRYSAACTSSHKEAHLIFDTLTGEAKLDGHSVFTLEASTGKLRVHPAKSLTTVLDDITTTSARRMITLTCAVYGHYEWSPEAEGTAISTNVEIELRDDTCWTTSQLSFAQVKGESYQNDADCRKACRANIGCTHYAFTDKCQFYQQRCDPSQSLCQWKNKEVQEKIPNCGERSTCIRLTETEHKFLAGDYCPIGDNGPLGPVFRKEGMTVQDTFYLTPYSESRDSSQVDCTGGWVIKQVNQAADFQDEEVGYVELHGDAISCLDKGVNFVDKVFTDGQKKVTVTGSVSSAGALASVSALPCGPPNVTYSKKEDEGEDEERPVEPIVLDDPTTTPPDDHWLHPCECFPESWGENKPVIAESLSDVPAGSGNKFLPARFDIINGEFFCEQEGLLPGSQGMHLMDDGEANEKSVCETACRENPLCKYFWEGEIMSTKQCRFYKHCTVLVREPGASGSLVALPSSDKPLCRVANPDVCWKVTKRRAFLGASEGRARPNFLCAWENLVRQCDHKLLLGGLGVESCGKCEYADINSHAWNHKTPVGKKYHHGQQLTATCWEERYAAVPVGVGSLKAETLTCTAGQWFGSQGHLGLAGFACAALVQVVRSPYRELDAQGKQEIYFTNQLEVQILVDVKKKMLVTKGAKLEKCSITPPEMVGTFRMRSLKSDEDCMAKVSGNSAAMQTCAVVQAQLFYFDGEQMKTSQNGDQLCFAVKGDAMVFEKCSLGQEQAWYWDENRFRSRSDSSKCLGFDSGSKKTRMVNCDSSDTAQQWYADVYSPLRPPEAPGLGGVVSLEAEPAISAAEFPGMLEKLEKRLGGFGELTNADMADAARDLKEQGDIGDAATMFIADRTLRTFEAGEVNVAVNDDDDDDEAVAPPAPAPKSQAASDDGDNKDKKENDKVVAMASKTDGDRSSGASDSEAETEADADSDFEIDSESDQDAVVAAAAAPAPSPAGGAASSDSANLNIDELEESDSEHEEDENENELDDDDESIPSFLELQRKANSSGTGINRYEQVLHVGEFIGIRGVEKRFMGINGGELFMSAGYDFLPGWFTWEIWQVVDAGNGLIALHNYVHNRFLTMGPSSLYGSEVKNSNELPGGWQWERFKVINLGHREFALWSPSHKRCVRMNQNTKKIDQSDAIDGPSSFPSYWGWERLFKFKAVLYPGAKVVFYNNIHKRFIRLNSNRRVDTSGVNSYFPPNWQWEPFQVVHVGNSQFGFWNPTHKRFLRMNGGNYLDGSDQTSGAYMPSGWEWEKFNLCPGTGGSIGLRSPKFGKYMKMRGDTMELSPVTDCKHISGWTWEYFEIRKAEPVLKIGDYIGLRGLTANKYLGMRGDRSMFSNSGTGSLMPGFFTWEVWRVVDAGNDEIALHNYVHNRFLCMGNSRNIYGSEGRNWNELPGNWQWERFKIIDHGDNTFSLWNAAHKRLLRMRGDNGGIDASDNVDAAWNMNPGWAWEKFERIEATLYPGAVVAFHSRVHNRFLRINNQACDASGVSEYFPSGWEWEKFKVDFLGGDQFAFWNPTWKRFLRMHDGRYMDGSSVVNNGWMPRHWGWEKFTICPGPQGGNVVGLRSSGFGRFVNLNSNGGSGVSSPSGCPAHSYFTWEWFDIVKVTTTTTTTPAPVNCVGDWSAYSACTKTCGGGTKTRYFVVSTPAKHNGYGCQYRDGQKWEAPCRKQPCPGMSYGGYRAETVPAVSDELKQFESTEKPGTCLEADSDVSFSSKTCKEGSKQFMEPSALSTLLWEKFVAASENLVPTPVVSPVSGRRRRSQVFLRDFDFKMDCGDHVVNSFSFNANGMVGMKGTCTAGATVGAAHTFSMTCSGGDMISSTQKEGSCIGVAGGNVEMQKCKGMSGQRWYWVGENLRPESDGNLCMSVHTDNNVYVRSCVSGANWQKWRMEDGFIKSSNKGNGMCVTLHGENVVMQGCQAWGRFKWLFGSGMDRLSRTPIVCPEGTVMSALAKKEGKLDYACSHVANLGACRPGLTPQVDTSSLSLNTLLTLGTVCTTSEALQSIETETSKKGDWIRFRYTCCALGGVPMSVVPTPNLVSTSTQVWEGIYAPVKRDDSGRLIFHQRSSFKVGAGLQSKLTFNRDTYQWCVDRDCVDSPLVHPLDEPLGGKDWQVVELSDFDGEFVAKGVGSAKTVGGKPPAPPKLIEFGATQPDYAPECKDDVTPGTDTFNAEKQWEVSSSLSEDNPCYYMGGKKATAEEEGEGTTWIANTLQGDEENGASNTYANVMGCWDREMARNVQLRSWGRDHDIAGHVLDRVGTIVSTICGGIPGAEAAPIGLGLEFKPNEICSGITDLVHMSLTGINDDIYESREFQTGLAGDGDCPPEVLGMARMFCDLHCIRDAVKAGDSAILDNLEKAVGVVGQNTQMLMEHYTGWLGDQLGELSKQVKALAPKSVMQQVQDFRSDMTTMFTEMHSFATDTSFDTGSSEAMKRALTSFINEVKVQSPKGNETLDQHLDVLQRKASTLHQRFKSASENSMPKEFEVEKRAAEWAERTEKLLDSRVSMLGVYTNTSHHSKQIQHWIKEKLQPEGGSATEELIEEESLRAVMRDLDTSWWHIREAMDNYLEAADTHITAYRGAVAAVQEYTSTCSLGFSSLKGAHKQVIKAEDKAHDVLQDTWKEIVPAFGLLAAKVRDADTLGSLALADVRDLDFDELSGEDQHKFCNLTVNSPDDAAGKTFVQSLISESLRKGLYGQTVTQLRLIFLDLALLKDRFVFGGLGAPPKQAAIAEAWSNIEDARKDIEDKEQLYMVTKLIRLWHSQGHCGQSGHHRHHRHSLRH